MPPFRDGLEPCRTHVHTGKRYWSKSLWVEANWSMESLNLIYTHIGGVHPQLSRADKEYYLSFRLTPPRWIFGYFLLRANKANAWSQQSRLNYLPTLEVYCLGNLSSKWQNESTLHRFLSAHCDVIHSWRVDSKSVDATLSTKQPCIHLLFPEMNIIHAWYANNVCFWMISSSPVQKMLNLPTCTVMIVYILYSCFMKT